MSSLASSCVEPSLSYAIIERPLYEKVVCCIPLYLAAGDGAQLAGLHHADILAEMSLYPDPPAEAGCGTGVRYCCKLLIVAAVMYGEGPY